MILKVLSNLNDSINSWKAFGEGEARPGEVAIQLGGTTLKKSTWEFMLFHTETFHIYL